MMPSTDRSLPRQLIPWIALSATALASVGVAAIAIDHVGSSPEWQVGCARIGTTWLADHRPVVAEVWLRD